MSFWSNLTSALFAVSLSCGGSVARAQASMPAATPAAPQITVYIGGLEGTIIGYADLSEGPGGLTVHASSTTDSGLTPGEHGLHIHAYGYCDATVGFTNAGGHVNPTDLQHGKAATASTHAGDLGNLTVQDNGSFDVTVTSPFLTLTPGEPTSLVSEHGAALMIHADADDMTTDPTGNAGGRVGCGIISRVADPALLPAATPLASPAATPVNSRNGAPPPPPKKHATSTGLIAWSGVGRSGIRLGGAPRRHRAAHRKPARAWRRRAAHS